MTLTFYPHEDELESSTIEQRLEVLFESAERFKAVILDTASKSVEHNAGNGNAKKRAAPRDMLHAFNWEEIARLLHDVREMSEATQAAKLMKAEKLTKLAEIYEVLRGAKMAKLEAVRLALIGEANQLRASGGAQVA